MPNGSEANANVQQFLSQAQLTAINRGLAAVDKAHQLCDLAANCGNNVDGQRDSLEETRASLDMYKQTFFPSAR